MNLLYSIQNIYFNLLFISSKLFKRLGELLFLKSNKIIYSDSEKGEASSNLAETFASAGKLVWQNMICCGKLNIKEL